MRTWQGTQGTTKTPTMITQWKRSIDGKRDTKRIHCKQHFEMVVFGEVTHKPSFQSYKLCNFPNPFFPPLCTLRDLKGNFRLFQELIFLCQRPRWSQVCLRWERCLGDSRGWVGMVSFSGRSAYKGFGHITFNRSFNYKHLECTVCSKSYIRETKRLTRERYLEHQWAALNRNVQNPCGAYYITQHNDTSVPTIPFSSNIIHRAEDHVNQKLGETIHIAECTPPLNTNCGGNSSPQLENHQWSAHMHRTIC